jgi:PmbA protein
MVREILTLEHRSLKLGVVNSQIASVRTQDEVERAVRVYDGGAVGTASAAGAVSLDTLTDQARAALSLGIPYPPEPSADASVSASHAGPEVALDELVGFTEDLLARLTAEFPDFILSQGVTHTRRAFTLQNDLGLDLRYEGSSTSVVLVVKERGSANIIDTFVFADSPELGARDGVDALLEVLRPALLAHSREQPAPSGRVPVVFASMAGHAGGPLLQLFQTDCTARSYATGSSLFSGKLNDPARPFHPDFHLADTRDAAAFRVCPFDMEGVVRARPALDIVRDGAVRNIAANKRDALRYDLPPTGSAVGALDELPSTGLAQLAITPTAPDLAALLGGREGLLVWFSAGGDVTRTGDISLPVQVAFKVAPDGQLLGRVPGLTLTGNLFKVFGEDYVGATEEKVDRYSEENFLVTHMTAHPAGG